MKATKTALRHLLLLVATAALLSACSGDPPTEEASPSTTSVAGADLECEREGYPCSLADVPLEILERSDELADEAMDMIEEGASTAEAAAWLSDQANIAEVQWDEGAVRFRLEGGREVWLLSRGALGTSNALASFTAVRASARRSSPVPFHIVGGDKKEKKAVVLSPMLWLFGNTDDGAAVGAILSNTRGYEGGVKYEENATTTETQVGLDDFAGWGGYDVVHVSTEGDRVCEDDGTCWAAIVVSTLDPLLPPGPGSKAEKVKAAFDNMGLAWGQIEGTGIDVLFATADFFRPLYGTGGLQDTLIFLNGCKTIGGGANDLADTLKGSGSVYLGWDGNVLSNAAEAASVALYQELSEGGYPAEVAYDKIGGSASGGGAQLILSKRSDGGDLRIREVVTVLHPETGEELLPSDEVSIEGNLDDDEDDGAPFLVQVDGVLPEFAEEMEVRVEVDGVAAEPVTLSDGERNEDDQWMISGVVDLGYDLGEEKDVAYRARTDLHSGGQSTHATEATLVGMENCLVGRWSVNGGDVENVHAAFLQGLDATVSVSGSVIATFDAEGNVTYEFNDFEILSETFTPSAIPGVISDLRGEDGFTSNGTMTGTYVLLAGGGIQGDGIQQDMTEFGTTVEGFSRIIAEDGVLDDLSIPLDPPAAMLYIVPGVASPYTCSEDSFVIEWGPGPVSWSRVGG